MAELQENPFVVEERREPLRLMLESSNKLALATASLDDQVTAIYTMNVLMAAGAVSGADQETAPFATMWELGRFIQNLYGENEAPDIEVGEVACGHAECNLHHQREAAITEAALRGDGDALIGVCKSAMREAAKSGDPYPEREVMKLYASTLLNVCLAFTRLANGEEDHDPTNN